MIRIFYTNVSLIGNVAKNERSSVGSRAATVIGSIINCEESAWQKNKVPSLQEFKFMSGFSIENGFLICKVKHLTYSHNDETCFACETKKYFSKENPKI